MIDDLESRDLESRDLELPAELTRLLRDAGVSYSVERQDAPAPPGGALVPPYDVVRTLVFRDRAGRFILAACPAGTQVHYGQLARAAGVSRAALRPADAEDLTLVGMQPGGATPLCAQPEALVVLDASLRQLGVVHCGTGRAGQSLVLTAQDLIMLAGSAVIAEFIR